MARLRIIYLALARDSLPPSMSLWVPLQSVAFIANRDDL
jgi:hypothetical protein